MMRYLGVVLVIVLVLCAYAIASTYGTGTYGGSGGGGTGGILSADLQVAEDGAWPVLRVRSKPGFEHGLAVYVPEADESHPFAASSDHRHLIVPEVHVSVDDMVRVVLVGASGADSLVFFDELVKVRGSPDPGIQVEWELDGPMAPVAHVTVGLGYDVALYVGLEAIGANGAARYQAFSTADQEGLWQFSLVMLDDVYMVDGETLKAYVEPQRPGGGMQPMSGEKEFTYLIDRAPAPVGLAATPSDSLITVAWTATSGADQYRLYRQRGTDAWERVTVWDKISSVTLPDRVYIPPDATAKDHTFIQDPATGRYHVIGIDAVVAWSAGGEKALYHTSTDLAVGGEIHHPYLEIEHFTDTMDPGGEWGTADGYRIDHLWAPELKLHDGWWHLFFAGIDRTDPDAGLRVERIFYSSMPHGADITDPANWSPAVMVLEGEGGDSGGVVGITAPTGYSTVSGHRALCRDPFVKYNPQDGRWYMVMTVAAQSTGQAIGLASSVSIGGPYTLHGYFTGTNGPTRESPVFTWWPDQELWIVHYNVSGQTGWGYGPVLLGELTIGSPNISGLAAYEPLDLPSLYGSSSYLTAWPEQTAESHSWLVMAPRMGYNYNWLRQVTARMDGSGMRLTSRSPAQLLVQEPASMDSPSLQDRSYTPGAPYNYTVTAATGGEVSEQAAPKSATGYRDVEINNLFVGYSGLIQGNWTVTVEPREVSWQWRARTAVNESLAEPDCSLIANWSAWSSWATVDRPARSAGATLITVAEDRWLSAEVEVRSTSRPLEVHTACSSAYRPLNLPTPSDFASDHPVPDNPAMVDRDTVEFSWTNTAAEHPNFEGYYVTWERSSGDDCDGEEYITRPPGEWPMTWDDPTWTVTWQHLMEASQDPCNGYYTYKVASYGGSLTSGTVSALVEWIEFAVGMTNGYNYWLPDWVQQSADARLVATGSTLIDDIANLDGEWAQVWRPHWKDFHTADGVFDWTAFDAKLGSALGSGSDLQLNLLSSEMDYVPTWVKTKHGIVTETDSVKIDARGYAPVWPSAVRAEYEAFVAALGARYKDHPQISSWYVHGISSSQGEELYFGSQTAANNAWTAGLTPEVMVQWLGDRLDAFAAAFAGHTHKLMWVGEVESNRYIQRTDGDQLAMKWSDAASILAHKAWALGMGHRGGNIERVWNKAGWAAMQDTSWAQTANPGPSGEWDHRHGYLELNESIWPISSPSIAVGEENEEYGNLAHWITRFGPLEHHPIRYELSMMRALQMRVTHLWVYGDGVAMNDSLTDYVRLSMGRWAQDSPDAWTRLCSAPSSQYYVGGSQVPGIDGTNGLHHMRNIEYLLEQRDVPASEGVPGGELVPTGRTDRTYDALNLSHSFPEYRYDNLAARTDLASGNSRIYFRAHDQWGPDELLKAYVTYRDSGIGRWRIEYTDKSGLENTYWVDKADTGLVVTAELPMIQPSFSGSFGGALGMDFAIVAETDDLEVRLVRLVRWLEADGSGA